MSDTAPPAPRCRLDEPAFGVLGRAESALYRSLCGATLWVDGFFGEPALYEGAGNTFGRLTIGGWWDQRDGLDPRVRLRARVALPALERRARLLVGIGDADAIVDGSADSYSESVDQTFATDADDQLLLGLGFSPSRDRRRGFDFEGGVEVTHPPVPYTAVNYRWFTRIGPAGYARVRLRGFWLLDDGFGTSLTSTLDHTFNEALMLRWSTFSRIAGAVDGVEWRSRLALFQVMSNNQAFTWSTFVQGQADASTPLRDYGLEIRWRRRAFHPTFFVELATGLSWPLAPGEVQRSLNPGVGVDFELHFGRRPRPRGRRGRTDDPRRPGSHFTTLAQVAVAGDNR